jgi:hypothetical protein
MRANSELSNAIEKAFSTALLLTASETMSEAAVLHGIGELSCDQTSGETLQLEVVKAAIRGSVKFVDQLTLESPILPIELRPVLLLESRPRHCFVLRALLGMTREACSGILRLTVEEIDDAVLDAVQTLPLLSVARIKEPCYGRAIPHLHTTSADWRSSLVLQEME